jgi:PAS domain-containing protein
MPGVLRRGLGRRSDTHLLAALMELLDIAVVTCSPDGRLSNANRHARDLLGSERTIGSYPDCWMQELSPRTASGIPMKLEDLPPLRALCGEVVRAADVLVTLRGEDRLLETAARPAADAGGRRRGAVITLRDVTEERRREAILRAGLFHGVDPGEASLPGAQPD